MRCGFATALGWLGAISLSFVAASTSAEAATVAEVAAKVKSLKAPDRIAYLLKGAQAEGELAYYGTLPIDEFLPLARVYNSRYRAMALQPLFLTARRHSQSDFDRGAGGAACGGCGAGRLELRLSVDERQSRAGLSSSRRQPLLRRHLRSRRQLAQHVLFDDRSDVQHQPVKAEQAPKSYEDLLSPSWKGKMLFDPEAGYILAAMEEAWGREKAVNYLTRLSKQDLSYRRGGTLTTQVVSSGEYPIGIAINGETSAAIREKGAPLGFKVLAPAIVKPEGLFVMKNAPHPHAALLFVEWVLSDEAQGFLAGTLGKGSAMKGVRSKFKEFQVKPDYVVNPKLGANLQTYIQDFRKIMGAP